MTGYPTFFPTVDRIVELHASAIDRYGGIRDGHVDRGCIEGSLGAALNAALYSSPSDEPDPYQCAVHIFCTLNKKQCFTDGTKRTAWMSFCECLLAVGLKIEESQEAVIDFCLGHAKGDGLQIDSASAWLAPRLRAA
jgi:prophage maintenance system killer protein